MNFKELSSVFIIAELSANHNGSIQTAVETIRAAKRAGANAIKLQTYRPDTITLDSHQKDFLIDDNSIWRGQNLYDLYKKAYTPWEWHPKLFEVAKEEGLICFSSPFDLTAVDLLEELNNPIYKIASFEITDIPLIRYVASKGKPIIISTGIATDKDIKLALKACKDEGNKRVALLKCTSSYPAKIEEANLMMIKDFTRRYKVVSGLSDHTLGIVAPVVAVTQGAKIIEKHFILEKSIGGPDASFSLDEKEFRKMVEAVRESELAIGEIDYSLSEKQKSARNYSRSLYVSEDVKKGDIVTESNIKSVRPGYGMHPKHLPNILGKIFTKDCRIGTRVDEKLFK
ncbi:MAG: pseudaminic acid synthase [Flavobacteriaceae bacterium]|nr:pseudaminic acid synthase [Flavobacteriaceae bacterium]|tara:strand:- start:2047 stop:3072 length:1026 start_codon:yes stop_codon:yes gene_type:complete